MSDEPSEEEVLQYAGFLQMQLPEDKDLLWIAREGVRAPLPAPWTECRTDEDQVYFYNFDTGESLWEHPSDDYYRQQYQAQKSRKQALHANHQLRTSETDHRTDLRRLHQEALKLTNQQEAEKLAVRKADTLLQIQTEDSPEINQKREKIRKLKEEIVKRKSDLSILHANLENQRKISEEKIARERETIDLEYLKEITEIKTATAQKLQQERELAENVFQRLVEMKKTAVEQAEISRKWVESQMQIYVQERLNEARRQAEIEYKTEKYEVEEELKHQLQSLIVTPAAALLQEQLNQYKSQVKLATSQRKQLLEAQMQAKLHSYEHQRNTNIDTTPRKVPISVSKTDSLRGLVEETKDEIDRIDQELMTALKSLVEARNHSPDSIEAIRKLQSLVLNPNLQV